MGVSRSAVNWTGLVLLAAFVSGTFGYCRGSEDGRAAAKLETDTKAVAAALDARKPIAAASARAVERVARADATVRSAHDAARVLDPFTLEVRVTAGQLERVTVPAPVIARIVEDSLQLGRERAAIDSLVQLRAADSLTIARQAVVITDLRSMKTPRCGRKCGAVLATAAIIGTGAAVKNAAAIGRLLKSVLK